MRKFFLAFLALLALACGSNASASFPPVVSYSYSFGACGGDAAVASSVDGLVAAGQAICAARPNLQGCTAAITITPTGGDYGYGTAAIVVTGSCYEPWNHNRPSLSISRYDGPALCPENSVKVGDVCTCPPGSTEQGSSCSTVETLAQRFCRVGGENKWTRAVTGKTGGGAPEVACMSIPGALSDGSSGACEYKMGDAVTIPQEDGTRQFSGIGTYTGSTCVPATDPVLGEPKPVQEDKCPGGFTGTVNGVEKCIPAVPDKGIEGIKTTSSTAADGTKRDIKEETRCEGQNCTTTRTVTTTPPGGGTPTVGVSSSTRTLADKCRTDPTNSVCVKTGTAPPVSITGNGSGDGESTCAGTTAEPCVVKVDETGVPSDSTTNFNSAYESLSTSVKSVTDAIAAERDAPLGGSMWTFSFQFPTGCSAYQVANFKGVAFTMNPCAYQSTIHDLMSMIWAAVTAFAIIGMVGRTLRST